jgi:hypothetical protein
VAGLALTLGEQLASNRDRSRPPYAAEGAVGLHDLAELYGEFQPNDLAPFWRERLAARCAIGLDIASRTDAIHSAAPYPGG